MQKIKAKNNRRNPGWEDVDWAWFPTGPITEKEKDKWRNRLFRVGLVMALTEPDMCMFMLRALAPDTFGSNDKK